MTASEYRAKAEQLLARAQLAEPKNRPDMIAIAISYLRLATWLKRTSAPTSYMRRRPLTVPMQQPLRQNSRRARQPKSEQAAQV
jgi:hypothetical protein